jgi:hypothetical protein
MVAGVPPQSRDGEETNDEATTAPTGQGMTSPEDDAGTHPRAKPVALVIISGGGFTFETKCLLRQIGDDFDFVYLRTEFGGTPGEGDLPGGESHPVPSFASKTRGSARDSLRAFVLTLRATRHAVRRHRVATIIAVGCSHAVPMLLAGRLAGVPTVFIESITRVRHLSATGKLVYHLRLARLFIVQWPGLHGAYPASRLGTIL